MQTRHFAFTLVASVVAASALIFAAEALAADGTACGHPALRAATCAPAGIDANTFLVQPPATARWVVRESSANGDHPAVVVARLQRQSQIDANTFIVQPPVAVEWTVHEPATLLAKVPGTQVH